jgi:hypothetical protein
VEEALGSQLAMSRNVEFRRAKWLKKGKAAKMANFYASGSGRVDGQKVITQLIN